MLAHTLNPKDKEIVMFLSGSNQHFPYFSKHISPLWWYTSQTSFKKKDAASRKLLQCGQAFQEIKQTLQQAALPNLDFI